MHQVLLIDDDEKLGNILSEYCAQFSIAIDHADRPSKGFEKLQECHYEAIILDVMLPEMDGFDVCRQIRKTNNTPIIMLTARGDVTDRIVGLEIGADDYLPKPFEPRELVARLHSNIKRHNSSAPKEASTSVTHYENFSITPALREVQVDGQLVELTTMEYEFLTLLEKEPGKTFSRDEILSHLKGTDMELFTRSVDILVSRLRTKLKPAQPIKTIHGTGYSFIAKRVFDE
ncbi:MAG: response regulator transcription factor [Gammaproteobacteria bacterium]|nr:response regulator transcription factor [Gammaproteobacteria bacterium]